MTEADWWGATNPRAPLDYLFFDTLAADRKSRLFSIACARRVEQTAGGPFATVTAISEAFADGRVSLQELQLHTASCRDAWHVAYEAVNHGDRPALRRKSTCDAVMACGIWPVARTRSSYEPDHPDMPPPLPYPAAAAHNSAAVFHLAGEAGDLPEPDYQALFSEWSAQVHLLHDIFGPLPFREVAVEPGWLTADVTALARGIYADKAFDRLPILADALQDAGCASADLLDHCRRPDREHVRGCWVVDLLLGKPWRDPPPA